MNIEVDDKEEVKHELEESKLENYHNKTTHPKLIIFFEDWEIVTFFHKSVVLKQIALYMPVHQVYSSVLGLFQAKETSKHSPCKL